MRTAEPVLEPGRVYRTAELRRWGANPTRLAERLEREGVLRRLGHGLVHVPRRSRFGDVPPTDDELLGVLLDGTPYIITGPPQWNALGLGSTALFARTLVYNTKRTELVRFGGRQFDLRRVSFPAVPSAEWFVVDLVKHADQAGVDRAALKYHLAVALAAGKFDLDVLREMAGRFGRRYEQDFVLDAAARAA